jgi:hypothetical protein
MGTNQLFYEEKTERASDDICWETGEVWNNSFSTILVTQANQFSMRICLNLLGSAHCQKKKTCK